MLPSDSMIFQLESSEVEVQLPLASLTAKSVPEKLRCTLPQVYRVRPALAFRATMLKPCTL